MKLLRTITASLTLTIASIGALSQTLFNTTNNEIINLTQIEDSLITPKRHIEQYDDKTVVSYEFPNFLIYADQIFEGASMPYVNGFGVNDNAGEPAYLCRTDIIPIPDKSDIRIAITESEYIDVHFVISPARPPLSDSTYEWYSKATVDTITAYDGLYPREIITQDLPFSYRDRNLMCINVHPVQYDYQNKTTRFYKKLTYEIHFQQSLELIAAKQTSNKHILFDDDYMLSTLIGDDFVAKNQQKAVSSSQTTATQYMLILTSTRMLPAAEKFARWKNMMGYKTRVAHESKWTPAFTKQFVRQVYSENDSLTTLLIIGSYDDVQAETFSFTYNSTNGSKTINYATDYYFACSSDAENALPNLFYGRIPARTPQEADIIIDKIINYEQSPVQDTRFYKTGLNCAYFQDEDTNGIADRRFAQTSEEVRTYLLKKGFTVNRVYYTKSNINPSSWNQDQYCNGASFPSELLKPNFAWNGNASAILNYINKGSLYVLHRDHGNIDGWGSPSFRRSNIQSLSNGEKLPIVFSMNCQTGMFNQSSACFAEQFLAKRNGGCVGIIAASETSFSGYNDALTCGIFDAIWPTPGLRPKIWRNYNTSSEITPAPTFRLGQILAQGKIRLRETLNNAYTRYTLKLFHCFGDPTLRLHLSRPTPFINGEDGFTIQRSSGGIRISTPTDANITFVDHSRNIVKSSISTEALYITSKPWAVDVCVSGHNKTPFIDLGPYYIQNTQITSDTEFNANMIIVGESVNPTSKTGEVIFEADNVTITAFEVIIGKGTSISDKTNLKINLK